MQFDYFYGSQAEQFSFYRIPKVLFTDPQFKPLSTDAKVLYGILLDRMSLSVKNHWLDEQSRNPLGAFWHKQNSTLVAEQTAISSIFAFFVSIYSVFVERPG